MSTRKFYSIGDRDKLVPSNSEQEALVVLIDKTELDELERKLDHKTEEVDRLYKKLTGENLPFRLIKLDIVHESFGNDGTYIGKYGEKKTYDPKYFVTIGLPVAHQLDKERIAENIMLQYFHEFVYHKRCRLHFIPKGGWSVQLELTQQEYLDFELPKSV